METPTTPKHPRITSIQHDSDVGRTPSYPSSHYASSTKIGDAKANLKTILANRVSFNDPNIIDVVVKPDEFSDDLVEALQDDILKDEVMMEFLTDVRCKAIEFESDMREPLCECELLNTIINFNKDDDAQSDEKHAHDDEEDGVKDNHPTPNPANDTNFARCISRVWLDVRDLIPRTDDGLFIPGMHMDYHEVGEDIVSGQKRSHPGDDEDDVGTPGPSKARRSSKEQQTARDGNSQGKTDAFEKRRPDLVLVDHSTQEPRQAGCFWRHIAALLEVKRDGASGPNPADGTRLTSLAAQLADMARLHLAACPFVRFSVHHIVCGPIFNLAIFDRADGVVSKDYHISKDLETFIRIIRRLGRDLDAYAYDSGLDNTIIPLFPLGSWKKYPGFRVTVGGLAYITKALPIRQSTGLVGRGTFVCEVVLEVDGEQSGKGRAGTLILKSAWWACARLAESTVYKILHSATEESTSNPTNLDSIAKFVDGGDIYDPQPPNELVKVSSHRKGFGGPINENDDLAHHRLVLAARARKLYEFTTFSQLMRAAKKISSGLRALHERGIIHGDISLGNLFLGRTEAITGFVSDLDLAKVDLEMIKKSFPESYDEVAASKRGALRTGTAIFMSMALLDALTKYYDLVETADINPAIVAPSGLDFVPGPGEDLESTIWVLIHAIMLHHLGSLQGSDKAHYQCRVIDLFYGRLSYFGLSVGREALVSRGTNLRAYGPDRWIPDPAQREWFRRAMALVEGQTKLPFGGSTKPITFDAFDALCDEFIMDE